jgi:hypothetical protein
MTSPTTGCGPAVACTPTASGATLTATTPTTQSTCYESTPIAITASLSDSTWQLTYRAPTSQYGAWNGTPPAGYNAATGLYTGAPTLVSGPQKLRQSAALLYTSAPAQLSALFGSTAQYGHSSPSALTTPFDASSLAAFGSFTACKSQSFTNP